MELIVLGCDGSWPGPGGACSGYLVRDAGTQIVLDLGSGTMARLQEHTSLAEIDAFFVTHEHPDHFADLYPLSIALFYGGHAPDPVPVYGPPGLFRRASGLLLDGTREAWEGAFTPGEIVDGSLVTVGPMSITAHGMAHSDGAVGYRIEAGGRVLAFTGDTGPTDAIAALAREADLLVSEATHLDGGESGFHLTARQAGGHAAHARAHRLLLTHLEPEVDRAAARLQAGEAFGGETSVAEPGMTITI